MLRAAAVERSAPAGGYASVDEVRGRAAFETHRAEWDALDAREPVDVPFASHAWLSAWLEAFAPAAEPLVLVARGRGGAALGMAAFLVQSWRGLVRLVAPANDHSCRVEWALGPDPGSAVAALWVHLRDRVRWDVLLLRDVPRDGPTSALLEPLARADRHLTGRWESLRTPFIRLGRSEEHTSELQSRENLVCRLLLEKKEHGRGPGPSGWPGQPLGRRRGSLDGE